MSFLRLHAIPAAPEADDLLLFAAKGRALLAGSADAPELPRTGVLPRGEWARFHPLGEVDGRCAWLLPEVPVAAPEGCFTSEVRPLLTLLRPDAVRALLTALALAHWLERSRYCGVCGTGMMYHSAEGAMRCPSCGTLVYPTSAPAVIVAVEKEGKLLLAHNKNFVPGRFSTLAGFVDPGESLEEAVHREVREEVGIVVKDLRYVASQSWPFPNSLMAAFSAQWAGGELTPDGIEIESAGWFSRDALPDIPLPGTVARSLIDTWLAAGR
jgi:NAD+ diphosphatase